MNQGATPLDYLKALPQYLLPGHLLSRLMLRITRIEGSLFRVPFTNWFVRQFKIDMREALEPDPTKYQHFNAFFTRALKPGARPIDTDALTAISPVDGTVSQFGPIKAGRMFQAKGRDYSLLELLGGNQRRAEPFMGGEFITIYLSPRDYHRIHMPLSGLLKEMVLVPGRVFSVNPATTRAVPRLFARNERVASIFDTEWGPLAVVKVAAIFVAGVETVWHGPVTPPAGKWLTRWPYAEGQVSLEKGAELGRFNMGSTVILVFAKGVPLAWREGLTSGTPLRMGEALVRRVEAEA